MEVDSSKTNGSAGQDEPDEEVEQRRAPDMQLDFDDLSVAEQERRAAERKPPASEPPMSEQPESDAEPISLRDLEMVFAPGVAPPALPNKPDGGRGRATSTPPPLPGRALPLPGRALPGMPLPGKAVPGKAARRKQKPADSDPELHMPAPPDSDLGDIAAFASLNPPPVKSKRAPRHADWPDADGSKAHEAKTKTPTEADIPPAPRVPAEEPRRAARRIDSDRPDSDRPRPPRKRDGRRIQDEPTSDAPPGSARRGRRSERPTKESGSGIHDLRMIVSMHPVATKADVDDEMLNLSGGLFKEDAPLAPIIAPDLSAFSTDAADEAPPPSRRAKRRKKQESSPPSTRPTDGAPHSRRSKSVGKGSGAARKKTTRTHDDKRPRKSKDRASESTRTGKSTPAEPQGKSRIGIWLLAAAALGGGTYVYVSSQGQSSTPTPVVESNAGPGTKTGDAVSGAKTPPEAIGKPTDTSAAEDTASAANTQTDSGTATAAGALPEGAWQPGDEHPGGEEPGGEVPGGEVPTGVETGDAAPGGAKPSEAPKAEFNKGAASAALSAAAGSASGCRTGSDPAGNARVMVTFASSGRVTQAMVTGPPFAGTATGGCIAKVFRSATVPPFEGSPVTVAKTARIQ